MRSLVAGMSRLLTPSGASASTTALTIAGSAPTVPASPAPLAPSGLRLVGTGFEVISMYGIVSARGMQCGGVEGVFQIHTLAAQYHRTDGNPFNFFIQIRDEELGLIGPDAPRLGV